ncbi:MAG: ATP-binding protein [Actinomycetota bacterium]
MRSGSSPPSGVVTLVFTDIEGSTRLVQTLVDRWSAVLADHREIMREAWSRRNGYEMGTEGDSFFVSFPSATDAVAACVDAQRALAAHDWPEGARIRVRIGMHTGEPMVVAGDYVGIDVHRAARIASAGHGGQILLSKTTRDLVDRTVPDGVTIDDLGEHRLKDLERPEWIFQLLIDGLDSEFPALKSLETPSNLPAEAGGFLGRERETADLTGLLERDDVRAVTLTGPGGTGKTRLALHVAAALLDRFRNGVYFVPIGASSDASAVVSEIAHALGLPEPGSRSALDSVIGGVRDKTMLIVLDNFEHVLEAAPDVASILTAARALKMIVTSRAPLRIAGEHEFPVPPLPLPAEAHSAEQAARSAAVALFVQRASAIHPGFALTDDNASVVADICRRLDGLPLAIELAASKTKVLPPDQILKRLGSALTLLKGGARDLPARQQTLRDTIGWSYELLDDMSARIFRALGVFPGGASLDSLEAVIGDDVLDVLGTLVDHSLVRRDDEPRFGMLETIREYALERLQEAGEAIETRRHQAEEMLRIAEAADAGLRGPDQSASRAQLERETENMRAALGWCLSDGADPLLGARIAVRLGWFWYTHGDAVEGARWLEAAEGQRSSLPDDVRAQLLYRLGVLLDQRSEPRARNLFEHAVQLFRAAGDDGAVAGALNSLGSSLRNSGDAERARGLFEEALALRRSIGDRAGQATALFNLGSLVLDEDGDPQRAKVLLAEALEIDRSLGDEWGEALEVAGLGVAALDAGELADAGDLLGRSLGVFHRIGETDRLAEVLGYLAGLAGAQGDAVRSARLIGAAEAVWETIGIRLSVPDRARFVRSQVAARASLDPDAFEQARREGRAMTPDQAVAFALANAG